jgi:hypothetical protein
MHTPNKSRPVALITEGTASFVTGSSILTDGGLRVTAPGAVFGCGVMGP